MVRYGSASSSTLEQEAQLRAIVENGGTSAADPLDPSKKPYVDATDDATLTAALSSISNTLASCSFELGGVPSDADRESLNLHFNGDVVPYDMAGQKQQGWGWLDARKTTVELYGDSCASFKSNRRSSVLVELGCAPVVAI